LKLSVCLEHRNSRLKYKFRIEIRNRFPFNVLLILGRGISVSILSIPHEWFCWAVGNSVVDVAVSIRVHAICSASIASKFFDNVNLRASSSIIVWWPMSIVRTGKNRHCTTWKLFLHINIHVEEWMFSIFAMSFLVVTFTEEEIVIVAGFTAPVFFAIVVVSQEGIAGAAWLSVNYVWWYFRVIGRMRCLYEFGF